MLQESCNLDPSCALRKKKKKLFTFLTNKQGYIKENTGHTTSFF